ncbi:hypothetical protein SODALDRAFT_179078 [Sodiomyces alkalinus F11]|uniref:Uncharacterized protein n=1 Tax=Sodiomyces alkalinus (strain CBS 110278 / VKM F-3762 / F11) TaxID=1314773 RepID=A0A3N2PU68_SODAK|nr:hypothetical protein SODALDRAFT_179078 [Sodiomyces alkalinus F11]ROT38004.1 hypothetical protein SODALDRAFT_179078 [Sodiomyces alkalinus F11]
MVKPQNTEASRYIHATVISPLNRIELWFPVATTRKEYLMKEHSHDYHSISTSTFKIFSLGFSITSRNTRITMKRG